MAKGSSVLLQIGLRVLVLGVGVGGVLLVLFMPSCLHRGGNYLECRLADGTALVASFDAPPRCWPRFGVKTLRLAHPPERVATFRLVSWIPHDHEDACFYDLYLADGHPYLLRRDDDSWSPETPGEEVTGEWFELLPFDSAAASVAAERKLLVHAAADQLAALAYAPEVQLKPPGK